jgi:hypothetical protein
MLPVMASFSVAMSEELRAQILNLSRTHAQSPVAVAARLIDHLDQIQATLHSLPTSESNPTIAPPWMQ